LIAATITSQTIEGSNIISCSTAPPTTTGASTTGGATSLQVGIWGIIAIWTWIMWMI